VQIVLCEDADDVVLERLRDGSLDVGVVARRTDDLEVRPLARVSLVAALSSDEPLAAQPAVTLADLEALPLLAPRTGFERIVVEAFAAEGRAPRLAFESGEAATALTLAAEGLGVAVVPELLGAGLPRGAVMRPLDPPITLDIGLAARPGDDPFAAAFLELA
jgi:DNA-binding transcriptional LysR family regulator